MKIPERLQILLRELGQRIGLNQLQLDADGGCALELDQRMVVSFQYRETDNALWLYTDLGVVPQRSLALYEKLLQANLFWQQTAGATLSLSADEPPHAVLAYPLSCVSLEETPLGIALETFVTTVETWQHQLHSAAAPSGTRVEDAALLTASAMELLLRSRV